MPSPIRAFPAALALLVACAPDQIIRLDGDPAEAAPLTTAFEALHPAADGVRRYVDAVRSERWEQAWSCLSASTRAALTLRGKPLGLRGIDLLRPLPEGADAGLRRLHAGEALAAFALPGAKEFEVPESPWPVEQTYDGRRLETRVVVKGEGAAQRTLTLAFEGAGWRIHDPTLSALPPLDVSP